ncbi:MAG TPA: hypothetical protein VFR04_08990 [Solirubrobacterales bacterium]|nr:hypothetical protein [Solirubrobacterales bacterium]
MRLARRYTDKWALAITLCWVAALAITGSTDALLFMAPALLIAIPLLGGHYVGEELIVELAARQARPARPATTSLASPLPPAPASWRPRGTGLIAFALAKRPPPGHLLAQN